MMIVWGDGPWYSKKSRPFLISHQSLTTYSGRLLKKLPSPEKGSRTSSPSGHRYRSYDFPADLFGRLVPIGFLARRLEVGISMLDENTSSVVSTLPPRARTAFSKSAVDGFARPSASRLSRTRRAASICRAGGGAASKRAWLSRGGTARCPQLLAYKMPDDLGKIEKLVGPAAAHLEFFGTELLECPMGEAVQFLIVDHCKSLGEMCRGGT